MYMYMYCMYTRAHRAAILCVHSMLLVVYIAMCMCMDPAVVCMLCCRSPYTRGDLTIHPIMVSVGVHFFLSLLLCLSPPSPHTHTHTCTPACCTYVLFSSGVCSTLAVTMVPWSPHWFPSYLALILSSWERSLMLTTLPVSCSCILYFLTTPSSTPYTAILSCLNSGTCCDICSTYPHVSFCFWSRLCPYAFSHSIPIHCSTYPMPPFSCWIWLCCRSYLEIKLQTYVCKPSPNIQQ